MEIALSDRIWIIGTFFVYTFGLLIIAIYSGRVMAKVSLDKYVSEFYTAGRGMGVIVVGFIMAAAICSSGTFVGGPGLAWSYGVAWSFLCYSFFFINFTILGPIGKKLGIVGRRINAKSYLDVFYVRYEKNKLIIAIGVISIILFLAFYSSAQFIGGARMLEVVTGLPYVYSLSLYAFVVILYSALGGLRGVSIACVFQGIAMTIGAICLFSGALTYLGGFGEAFRRLEAIKPSFVQLSGFNPLYTISLWVTFGLVYISMPHGTLGVLAYKDTKAMRKAIVVGAIIVPFWAILMNWSGFLAKAALPSLETADWANPSLSVLVLPPILTGVVIAGAASAAQSTIAAMIIAMSAAFVEDFYSRFVNPTASPKKMKALTTIATFGLGIATFGLALFPPKQLEWIVIYAIGGLACTFFWPMLLGLFWPRMNQWGALSSMVLGMATYIIAKTFMKSIAFGMDPIISGLVVSGVGGILVSILTPEPSMRTLQVFWGLKDPGPEIASTSEIRNTVATTIQSQA